MRALSTRRTTPVLPRLLLLFLPLVAAPAGAEWLIYIGGGLQETAGPWQVKGRLVLFRNPAGTLYSVRADDVDLPSSAFVSWQMAQRKVSPPAPASPRPAPPAACVPVRAVRVVGPDTLEIASAATHGGKPVTEVVHLAAFDGAELQHRFPDFSWFAKRAAETVIELLRRDASLCMAEEAPPRRDTLGHRLVYLRLASGADLASELLARGLGIAREGTWARAGDYRALEARARLAAVGHWGEAASEPTIAIVLNNLARGAGPAPPRAGSA